MISDRLYVLRSRVEALKLLREIVSWADVSARGATVFDKARKLIGDIDAREASDRAAARALAQRREWRVSTGRKNSGLFQIAPSTDGGVVHSASGIILARSGDKWLVWRSGGNYWSGRAQRYAPAELEIRLPPESGDRMPRKLTKHFEAGVAKRLSKGLILSFKVPIDAEFGPGVAEKIAGDLTKTVVFGE